MIQTFSGLALQGLLLAFYRVNDFTYIWPLNKAHLYWSSIEYIYIYFIFFANMREPVSDYPQVSKDILEGVVNGFGFSPWTFVPVGLQLALFFLVFLPLVFVRRREKPRRQLPIWACDILRIALAYAMAELMLALMFYALGKVPNLLPPPQNPTGFVGGPPAPPNTLKTPRKPDPSKDTILLTLDLPQELPPVVENGKKHKNAVGNGRAPGLILIVRIFETFPGLFVIYILYMFLLRLGLWFKVWTKRRLNDDIMSRNGYYEGKKTDLGIIVATMGIQLICNGLANKLYYYRLVY